MAHSGFVALCCSVCCDCLLSAFSTDIGCIAIGKSGLASVSSRCVITAFRATTTAFTAAFTTAFARFAWLALFASGFRCCHFTACSGCHGSLIS